MTRSCSGTPCYRPPPRRARTDVLPEAPRCRPLAVCSRASASTKETQVVSCTQPRTRIPRARPRTIARACSQCTRAAGSTALFEHLRIALLHLLRRQLFEAVPYEPLVTERVAYRPRTLTVEAIRRR